MTEIPREPYSGGMISEFQDLSDKIDALAAMTVALRRENATLRQTNAQLAAANSAYLTRIGEAQARVQALLALLPAPEADPAVEADPAAVPEAKAT